MPPGGARYDRAWDPGWVNPDVRLAVDELLRAYDRDDPSDGTSIAGREYLRFAGNTVMSVRPLVTFADRMVNDDGVAQRPEIAGAIGRFDKHREPGFFATAGEIPDGYLSFQEFNHLRREFEERPVTADDPVGP